MNERIKELESQAWEQVNRTNGLVRTEDFNQKFALLIVKECMNAVGNGPMERASIQAIKAAFGVEYYEPIEKGFGGSNE
jgi:hypothetical protein